MNLTLYTSSEKDFTSNGLGILREVINDEVHEILNGQFELRFQYPAVGRLFQEIVLDAYVTAAPNHLAQPQPFRIYKISKVRNGWVTVDARHICYELKRFVCEPVEYSLKTVAQWFPQIADHVHPKAPFAFESDIEAVKNLDVRVPTQVWKLLGSEEGCILDRTAGEYEFDKYRVILHARRGADRGVRIRYGRNLRDFTMDQIQGVLLNAIYPYCTDESGAVYELPEKYVVSPYAAEGEELAVWVFDCGKKEDLLERYGDNIGDIDEIMRSHSLFGILAASIHTSGYLTQPELNLTVDFVRLSETTEYRDYNLPDAIALGDTVHVEDPELGVSVSARVCEMRYQPSMDRIKSITLGSVKRSLAHTIATRTTPAKQAIKVDPDAVAAAGVTAL